MNRDNSFLNEVRSQPSSHQYSRWEKLQFQYERFLALRGSAIFLNLLFIFFLAYLFLLLLHSLLRTDSWDASLDGMSLTWHVFLEMLSPARISSLHSPPLVLLILSVLTTFVGFGFYSLLIAYASTKTHEKLNFFRSGLGPVIENEHTLILGFDSRVARLIQELNLSNHSNKKHPIVIMSELTKIGMSQQLTNILSRLHKIRVTIASGEPSRIQNLQRINSICARSAIILARCKHTASRSQKDSSDVRVIQTVKALYAIQDPQNRYPIVAEIFDKKRREMIDSLDDTIVTYDSHELIASILVQSAVYPGIERIYNELFSFEMSEFYFYEGVPEGEAFGDLIYHFQDGVPVGVQNKNKEVTMLPPSNYVFNEGDELLLIARDDQYINYNPEKLFQSRSLKSVEHSQVLPSQDILLIGWHYLAPAILKECCQRLAMGSTITVVMPDDQSCLTRAVDRLHNLDHLKIIYENKDPFTLDELERIDPFKYDTVFLLSRGDHIESEEQMDADTLVLVLLLRKLRDKQIGRNIKTRIVTQLFRPENEQLIDNRRPEQDDPVDFVLTSKTSTMLFTQLSEEGDMVKTYDILFRNCTYEIVLCPIMDYTETCASNLHFIDLYISALNRGEICIGFKSDMPEIQVPPYSGVYLNPPKEHSFSFSEEDLLVLLRPTQ